MFAGLSHGLRTAITHPPCPHKSSPLCPKPLASPCVSTSPLITSHIGLGPAHRTSFSPNHPFPRPASFCSLVLRGEGSAWTRELGGIPLSSCQPPCDRPWCLGPPGFFQPPQPQKQRRWRGGSQFVPRGLAAPRAPRPLSCVPPPAGLCPGPLPGRLKGSRTRGGIFPQPHMLCRAEDTQTGPGLPEKQRPWPLTPSPGLSLPLPQPQAVPSLSLLPAHHPLHPAQTPTPCVQALGARQPQLGCAVHTPTAGSPADLAPDRVPTCPLHMPLDDPLLQRVPSQPSARPAPCLGLGPVEGLCLPLVQGGKLGSPGAHLRDALHPVARAVPGWREAETHLLVSPGGHLPRARLHSALERSPSLGFRSPGWGQASASFPSSEACDGVEER